MRELKAEVHRLQKSLKEHKEQASNMKSQYADWNRKLQDKVRDLKTEKASWSVDSAAMRRAEAEANTFAEKGRCGIFGEALDNAASNQAPSFCATSFSRSSSIR